MSYRVTKADEAKPYEAAGHYNMLATRLHDAADGVGTSLWACPTSSLEAGQRWPSPRRNCCTTSWRAR